MNTLELTQKTKKHIKSREINYRPNLSNKLQNILNLALKFYNINYQQAYFYILSCYYKNKKDTKLSKILETVSEMIAKQYNSDIIEEYIQDNKALFRHNNIEVLSPARSAYVIYELYKDDFNREQQNLIKVYKETEEFKQNSLSSMEEYMIKSFFKSLTTPLRNPNIEIKEGQTKCYYDRTLHADFTQYLKEQLAYVEQNCKSIIETFNIED